jgi:hypothetical protein
MSAFLDISSLLMGPTSPSYGLQGFEVIFCTLYTIFMREPVLECMSHLISPLTPDYFLRRVLVGKTARGLIAQDLNCDVMDPMVMENLEQSRSYGAIMFPDEDED